MIQTDYVIFNPEQNIYAYFENNEYYCGWLFDGIIKADGFNCPDDARNRIHGLTLPSGRKMYMADPDLKGCVVHKRTIMVESEKV